MYPVRGLRQGLPQVHSIRDGIHKMMDRSSALAGKMRAGSARGALSIMGEEMDAGEVIGGGLKGKRYFESSGGGSRSPAESRCTGGVHKSPSKKGKGRGRQYRNRDKWVRRFFRI